MFKEDYIMNQIRNLANMLAKMVLHKETIAAEVQDQTTTGGQETLLHALCCMADAGDINRAENQLYETLDFADLEQYETALAFYVHLNTYTDAFLQDHDYSRAEIKEGICDVSKEFGVAYDVTSMMPDVE